MKNKDKKTAHKTDPAPLQLGSRFLNTGQLSVEVMGQMEKAYTHPEPDSGDLIPGIIAPGKASVIASYPSMGKTAMLINLGLEMRKKGLNIAVYLPSGSPEEFAMKAICIDSAVNLSGARRGFLPRDKWPGLTRAAMRFAEPGFFFERQQPVTMSAVWESVSDLSADLKRAGRRLDAVLIDSLNHIKDDEEAWNPDGGLRELARKYGVSVIATYGLRSREEDHSHFVYLGDLRLRGINETTADQLFYLVREEYWRRDDPTVKGMATLYCLLPYLGNRGAIPLRFDNSTMRFAPPVMPKIEDSSEQIVF